MEITALGLSSFKLRGKQATVVTDPYDSKAVGLKFPKNVEADVITVSHDHPDHNEVTAVGGSPFIVSGPGEYEIKGVMVIGVATFHDDTQGADRGKNTIYRIEIDGVKVGHLGDLGHVLSSAQVDSLNGVDVLFVPVGGVYSLDPVKAAQVISDLDPHIVIPMHYNVEGLEEKTYGALSPVSAFLKQMNKESVVPVSKLSVSKDKFAPEMQVVVLE
ncbi:MBL fold metallo-hydrolase [Candidatus Woesebacteria bacterium]|nr:MBL fold metallo-hydrolase [Candidatus Woesebacteria bacterium]